MNDRQKRQLKKLQQEMHDNSISLSKFLIVYYGIYSENIYNMSHRDVKFVFPYIKRISFENLLNDKKELYIGNIVAVKDSNGNVAPYIKPDMENMIEPPDISYNYSHKPNIEEKITEILIDENLSLYELSMLCKMFKNSNRVREYRIAYRLLKRKKDPKVKIYQKKKLNLKMKGREDYEEF